MSARGVNKSFGHKGRNYSLFKYKGGVNCYHRWERRIYKKKMKKNGEPYGGSFNKGLATFPKEKTSVIFGLRHLPAGGNKYLSISLDQARLYDRELKAEEVSAAFSGNILFVSDQDIRVAMNDAQNTSGCPNVV